MFTFGMTSTFPECENIFGFPHDLNGHKSELERNSFTV